MAVNGRAKAASKKLTISRNLRQTFCFLEIVIGYMQKTCGQITSVESAV